MFLYVNPKQMNQFIFSHFVLYLYYPKINNYLLKQGIWATISNSHEKQSLVLNMVAKWTMSVLNLGLWALGAHLHPDCTQVLPSYRHITSFFVSCKCCINLCPFFNRLVVVVVLKMTSFRKRSIQRATTKRKREVPSPDIPATFWF